MEIDTGKMIEAFAFCVLICIVYWAIDKFLLKKKGDGLN